MKTRLVIAIGSFALSIFLTLGICKADVYSDDFSVDSRGAYTVVNTWTQSGVGNFLYDAAGDRLQVKTGDNVGLAFSKELVEASASGVFRLDFFPNKKYPSGGILKLRLEQDADNYYEVENTDGYGPGKVRKIVGGQVVEEMAFPTEYRQGNAYRIEVYYSNGSVRVDAFGSGLALDQSIASILVSRMVVEISQQDAYFDNIYYTLGPFLKILAPIDYFIQEDSNLNAIAITSDIIKASGVKFTLRSADNLDIIAEYIDLVRPFEHIFPNLKKGEYQIDAIFIDSNGYELHGNFASDTAVQVGIGDVYVAIGDSITYGIGDDISTDNTSHDWRNISAGYSPILNNKLTTLKGYPHTILNEGVPGDTSSGGLTRIQEVIDRNPISKYFLILYGTNDSHSHNNSVPVRSGLDTNGKLMLESNPNYPGTFLHNMQTIIDKLKSSQKIPVLSKVPITLGPCSNCPSFPNPDLASRNLLIQEYNIVIDALVLINGILISPPDFYNYFRLHQNEMSDNLHPNGLGYQSMSNLWFDSITYSR
jgi:lysophospholipase L1-like esterase